MKLSALDLNLLVVLDVVLEEGSVTRAAEQLNMSVPAVSRALGRLRGALGDPLMVRSGRGLQPTATALDLKPRIRALVNLARDLLDTDDSAYPRARTFTIIAPTDVIAAKGPQLLNCLTSEMTGTQLRLLGSDRATDEADAVRDGTADIAISINASKHTDLHAEGLVREPLTAVVRAGHDLTTGPITPQRFAAWPRVLISRHGRLSSSIDTAMTDRGHPTMSACCAPDFQTGLQIIACTDLVAIAPRTIVTRLQATLNLAAIDAPITLKPLRVSQLWHPRHHHDAAHQRLRNHIHTLAAVDSAPNEGVSKSV